MTRVLKPHFSGGGPLTVIVTGRPARSTHTFRDAPRKRTPIRNIACRDRGSRPSACDPRLLTGQNGLSKGPIKGKHCGVCVRTQLR